MERADALSKIESVLRKFFNSDSISIAEDSTAKDVEGWTSIAHLSLIDAIEKEFAVQFSFSQVTNFKKIGDIIDVVLLK